MVTQSPFSSLIVVVILSASSWVPIAILAAYLNTPGLSGITGFATADAAASTGLVITTDFGVYGDLLQPRHHLRLAVGLEAAVELLRQEALGRHEHRHVVHRSCKAVAFVGRQQVFHLETAIAQRHHDLLGPRDG